MEPSSDATQSENIPDEVTRARQARIDAARQALLNDSAGGDDIAAGSQFTSRGDEMQNVYFGKGGVKNRDPNDELFPEGMNPDSFY